MPLFWAYPRSLTPDHLTQITILDKITYPGTNLLPRKYLVMYCVALLKVVYLILRMHVRLPQTSLDLKRVDMDLIFKATIIPKDAMPTKVGHTKVMSILVLEELNCRGRNTSEEKCFDHKEMTVPLVK